MRNARVTIWVIMLVCCLGVAKVQALVIYDYGGEWNIDFVIDDWVNIWDNVSGEPTTVNLLSGGSVNNQLSVYNTSHLNMYDGLIGFGLETNHDSSAYICGGAIGGDLEMWNSSNITIAGNGFNYSYGTLSNMPGVLTGTLLNGDPINNSFYIHDYATMTLVPEPSTILLLGLGGIFLRRRRKV